MLSHFNIYYKRFLKAFYGSLGYGMPIELLTCGTKTQAEISTEAKAEISTEAKAESSTEAKAESSTEAKAESSTEAKAESSTEAKAESSTEAKAESSTEAKAESSTEAKAESSTEAKAEISTETKAEISTEAKAESSTEAKAGRDTNKTGMTGRFNGDKYPRVANIQAPTEETRKALCEATDKQDLLESRLIGDGYLALKAQDDVIKNGVNYRVYEVDLTSKEYQKPREERCCPHCGAKGTLGQHRKKTIELKSGVENGKPYITRVTYPVWRCTKCKAVRSEPIPFRFQGTRLTIDLVRNYLSEFTEKHSKSSVHELSRNHFINDHQGAALIDFVSHQTFACPVDVERSRSNITQFIECNFLVPLEVRTCLLIDETALKRRDFVTAFIDPLTRHFLYYAKGRGAAAIHEFVEKFKGVIAADVKVSTDMSAVFMSTLKQYFPDLIGVYDRYHHMHNAKEKLEIEVKILASLLAAADRSDDAKHLRSPLTQYTIFALDLTTFTTEERQAYDKAMAIEEVAMIRGAYIELHNMFESQTVAEARAHMDQHLLFCDQIQEHHIAAAPSKFKQQTTLSDHLIERGLKAKTELDPEASAPLTIRHAKYNQVGTTKKTGSYCPAATLGSTSLEHLEELVNYVGTGLTTGPIEGFNNLLKLLKRVSFGIKRLDRFMCRLKLVYERDIDIEALLAA